MISARGGELGPTTPPGTPLLCSWSKGTNYGSLKPFRSLGLWKWVVWLHPLVMARRRRRRRAELIMTMTHDP